MPPGARKIAKVLRSLEKIRSTPAMGTKSSMAALGYVASSSSFSRHVGG